MVWESYLNYAYFLTACTNLLHPYLSKFYLTYLPALIMYYLANGMAYYKK